MARRNDFHISLTASRIPSPSWFRTRQKRVHAHLRTTLATEPDRPAANQIADRNSVDMPLPDRAFFDPGGLRPRRAGTFQSDAHVILVELFDRTAVQLRLFGDILDRARPAAAAGLPGEQLRRVLIVVQKDELFDNASGCSVAPVRVHSPTVLTNHFLSEGRVE